MKMQYGILALCIVFEATALQASQRSEGAEGIGGSIAMTRQAARIHNTARTATSTRKVLENYSRLPRSFEANFGQCDPKVRFLSRSISDTLFLTPNEVVLTFSDAGAPASLGKTRRLPTATGAIARTGLLRMEFVGANALPELNGTEELPGKKHYLRGDSIAESITNIPTYAKVIYHDIFPGVDLIFYGYNGRFEFDAIVAPGSDSRKVKLRFEGASRPVLSAQGDLIMETGGGPVQFHSPFAYQEVEGARKQIAARYRLKHNEVSFSLGPYDSSHALVIDPTLGYSTYLGSGNKSGRDVANAVAVDAAGNLYLAGDTNSADFPTVNAMFPRCASSSQGACNEGFIAKLDAGGSRLVYSTYLTGSWAGGSNFIHGIAADAAGNAYVTGTIASTTAFVMKLDPTGARLWIQTFMGGPLSAGWGVAVDKSGYIYVTGDTMARDFSPLVNPLQPKSGKDSCTVGPRALGYPQDAFVAKLSPWGGLVYSTFLGGDGFDAGRAITADDEGNAYVVGNTSSANFPTVNPLQGTIKDLAPFQVRDCNYTKEYGGDAFLAKINPDGSALLFSTYLGGILDDAALGVALDGSGNILMTGQTGSPDFPVKNPLQPDLHGQDGFIAKINPAGTQLVYSTFIGGYGNQSAAGVAADANGNAYVTGWTASSDFPLAQAIQPLGGNGWAGDAFVLKLNATGDTLFYSTLLGGTESDAGTAIAIDPANNACVAGQTNSIDFPTVNPFQRSNAGNTDAFVARVTDPYFAKSHFAHFSNGQGISSTLVLVNPSATKTATGTDELYDSAGRPLSVDINGTIQQASFPFSIPPTGVGFYATGGAGERAVGSLQVSSSSSVGGTILFSGDLGVAGVGSAQMTLPAKGHTARFVEELYEGKGINLAAFRGVLEVISPIPINGMALRATPHEYATLPVTTVK